ncbi:MAG: LysM peptidoglycan-binding domain-containing protein [Anaerolineae bacterium]
MRKRHIVGTTWVLLCLGAALGCSGASPTSVTPQLTPTSLPPTPFSFENENLTPALTLTPTPSSAADPSEEVPAPQTPTSMPMTQHTVEPGDTLLTLALRYSVPMAAIQQANGLGASIVVQAGQTLDIPPSEAWAGASPFWVLYEVAPGDTLFGLGAKYDVDVERLREVNDLSGDAIRVGQTLILPLEAPVAAQVPDPTPTPMGIPPTVMVETTVEIAATPVPPTPAPTAAPTVSSAPPPADVAAWPREVARLINEVRAVHGLPPLAYNETLAAAAQAHANDCAARGWCSHTGSDGAYIKERLERVGYTGAGWAECWAQRLTPQGAIDIWMDEVPPNDPHRRTLLSTWLTEVGVGVAETDWGYYFIADFGRP